MYSVYNAIIDDQITQQQKGDDKTMVDNYIVEHVQISTMRNVWGFYTGSGFVNGVLLEVKYDRKPRTKKQVKADLTAYYARLH